MKKLLNLVFFCFIGISSLFCYTIIDSESVTGTWTLAGSPYHVITSTTVKADDELYIEPGVEVLFDGNKSLTIKGYLNAVGTADNGIIFSHLNNNGTWRGINFVLSSNSILEYCSISYTGGANNPPSVSITGCNSIILRHCDIKFMSTSSNAITTSDMEETPFTVNSNILIEFNHIHNSKGSGIIITGSHLNQNDMIIRYNEINDLGASGTQYAIIDMGCGILDISENGAIINNNKIYNNLSIYGGGACLFKSSFYNNEVYNNAACLFSMNNPDYAGLGGGVCIDGPVVLFEHNLIYDNIALTTGDNLFINNVHDLEACTININNCTVSTLYLLPSIAITSHTCSVHFTNSILWGNDALVSIFNSSGNSEFSFKYNNIQNGSNSIVTPRNIIYENNINSNPLFIYNYLLDYWSPSIDAGDPTSPLDPDETIADQGWKYAAHEVENMELHNGWNWIATPILQECGTDSDGNLFEYTMYHPAPPMPGFFQYFTDEAPFYSTFQEILTRRDEDPLSLKFEEDIWTETSLQTLFRHEGYKIKLSSSDTLVLDGYKIAEHIYSFDALEETWVGYFLDDPQNIKDVFDANDPDLWDKVDEIQSEKWVYYTDNNNQRAVVRDYRPWGTSPDGKSFEYGKAYIITMSEDVDDFQWLDSGSIDLGKNIQIPQNFVYEDRVDYETIEIISVEDSSSVVEIGAFQGETCVGAVVVDEFPVQLLAYSDSANRNDPEITFQIIEDNRSKSPCGYTLFNYETGEFELEYIKARTNMHSVVKLGRGDGNNVTPIKSAKLHNNYPNPFNPNTFISFSLPKTQNIEFSIYNVKGQKVTDLYKGIAAEGDNKVQWNGTDNKGNTVSSGIYFYQLKTDNDTLRKRMLLLK